MILWFKELSDFDLHCFQWNVQQGIGDQDFLNEFRSEIAEHLRHIRGRYSLRLNHRMLGIVFTDPVDAVVFHLNFSHLLE